MPTWTVGRNINSATNSSCFPAQAELRCRVFQALYDSKQLRERVPRSRTSHFLTHSGTTEGRLILSLVKDLLQQLDLSFTLSVFDVEVNKAQVGRKDDQAIFGRTALH